MTRQNPASANPEDKQLILPTDTLTEKVKWSLVKQISAHTRNMNSALFDCLDDFLFDNGQRGSFSDENNYLKVMRELRTKKALYEKSFLDFLTASLDTIPALNESETGCAEPAEAADERQESIDVGDSRLETAEKTAFFSAELREAFAAMDAATFDRLELDLAVEKMKSKAMDRYSSLRRQLSGPDGGGPGSEAADDILVTRVLAALVTAQSVFRFSRDSRLLFFKIFERKYLWNMEKMYLDLINVINNRNDQKFVDSLYFSALQLPEVKDSTAVNSGTSEESAKARANKFRFEFVNESASLFINELCAAPELPDFVSAMLRSYWSDVLILVGIHQGVDSSLWQASKQTAVNFVKSILATQAVTSGDQFHQQLRTQLREGFAFLQLAQTEIDEFFRKLDRFSAGLQHDSVVAKSISHSVTETTQNKSSRKAAISEAGRKILDDEDLDDIVALLSDAKDRDGSDDDSTDVDASLEYYLGQIDKLIAGKEFEYIQAGSVHNCRIRQVSSAKNSYQVLNSEGQVLLVRSRIGLAVSARAGEIRYCGNAGLAASAAENQSTLIPPPDKTGKESIRSH